MAYMVRMLMVKPKTDKIAKGSSTKADIALRAEQTVGMFLRAYGVGN